MHNDIAKRIAANRRQAVRIEKELCALPDGIWIGILSDERIQPRNAPDNPAY